MADNIDFKLKTKYLKRIINTVNTMVEETIIIFDKDGITVKAMDPANVGMANITLEKGAFDKYNATDGKIGINLNKVDNFINLVDDDELIDIRIEKNKKMTLQTSDLFHEMHLLDTSTMTIPNIPAINMINNVKLNSNYLKRGERAVSNVSDYLTMEFNPEKNYVKIYTSNETKTEKIELTITKDNCEDFNVKSLTKSLYGLEYFTDILTSIDTDTILDVRGDQDYPLKIKYDFADGKGLVMIMIAPRIYTDG